MWLAFIPNLFCCRYSFFVLNQKNRMNCPRIYLLKVGESCQHLVLPRPSGYFVLRSSRVAQGYSRDAKLADLIFRELWIQEIILSDSWPKGFAWPAKNLINRYSAQSTHMNSIKIALYQGGMKGLPMMLRVKNTCFHTATSRKWRFSRVKYRFFGWIVCFFL